MLESFVLAPLPSPAASGSLHSPPGSSGRRRDGVRWRIRQRAASARGSWRRSVRRLGFAWRSKGSRGRRSGIRRSMDRSRRLRRVRTRRSARLGRVDESEAAWHLGRQVRMIAPEIRASATSGFDPGGSRVQRRPYRRRGEMPADHSPPSLTARGRATSAHRTGCCFAGQAFQAATPPRLVRTE